MCHAGFVSSSYRQLRRKTPRNRPRRFIGSGTSEQHSARDRGQFAQRLATEVEAAHQLQIEAECGEPLFHDGHRVEHGDRERTQHHVDAVRVADDGEGERPRGTCLSPPPRRGGAPRPGGSNRSRTALIESRAFPDAPIRLRSQVALTSSRQESSQCRMRFHSHFALDSKIR